VEVKLGVADVPFQEVATKRPPLDPNGELAVDPEAARRDVEVSVLPRVGEDVLGRDGERERTGERVFDLGRGSAE
jgi:hypothetical protein